MRLRQPSFSTVIKPSYVWLRQQVTNLAFERRYGVRTTDEVFLEDLGLAHQDRNAYRAASWLSLRRVLPRSKVSRDDVFIDFGSGKGRIVILAATYPFRRVIGVELSPELVTIAANNLERARSRLCCSDVSLVQADALDYHVPDDVTVTFFYNPFGGEVFSAVIKKLIASVDRNPRTIRMIYVNPVEEQTLLGTGRVRLLKSCWGMRPTREWSRSNSIRLYAIDPVPAGEPDRAPRRT